MDGLKIFCFIYIVFATLQTSHSYQEDCTKYDEGKSCAENGVRFFLRTNKLDNIQELLVNESDTIKNAGFLPGKPLKFIVHGHSENKDDYLVTPLQQEYFELEYNVVVINYNNLSYDDETKRCYRTGVENSFKISECAAKIIEAIITYNDKHITMEHFHLIGLSLGGQIVGQIPHEIGSGYGTLPRITGIDPANEGFFEDYGTDECTLTAKDARLVDVIHSNAGIFGKMPPMGHIDWYPNGGSFQPECPPGNYLCAHLSSMIYYIESVADPNFKIEAQWCPDLETLILKPHLCDNFAKVRFGEHVTIGIARENMKPGVYFFKTKATPPYIREDAFQYSIYEKHLRPPYMKRKIFTN